MRPLLDQMCDAFRQAEEDAQRAAEPAAIAAAPALATHNQALPHRHSLHRNQRGRPGLHAWEPHSCSAEQKQDLAALGSRLRELCLLHEACADELVAAVAALPGKRLQQMLVRCMSFV